MAKKGTISPAASEQYLRLLKGELSPEDYAKSVKKRVDDRSRSHGSSKNGTHRERT